MDPTDASANRARFGRAMAVIAALCAIGLVILGGAVGNGPLPIDVSIRNVLHVGDPVPVLLQGLNVVGGALVWDAGVALLIAALWLTNRRAEAAWICACVLIAEVLATALKLIVDRPRPPGVSVVDLVTQASFPSGHVTRAAVTGLLIVLFWPGGPRSRILAAAVALAIALLMGVARIVAGEHWPTDVVGAYLLAGIVVAGAAAIRVAFRQSGRVHPRKPEPDPRETARSP